MNRFTIAVIRAASSALILVALGCSTVPKKIPNFDNVARDIEAVTVMPPDFNLQKVGAFSSETLSEIKHDIEVELQTTVEQLVEESNYHFAVFETSDETLAEYPDLRSALFRESQRAASAYADLRKTRSKVISVQYAGNLDDFADRTDCDHFLFVQGGGWFRTTGSAVMAGIMAGLFGTGAKGSQIALEGMLVDANRAQVLWYNSVTLDNKDPRKPRDLLKASQKLLKPLLGKSGLKGDKSRDDVIVEKYKGKELEAEAAQSADR